MPAKRLKTPAKRQKQRQKKTPAERPRHAERPRPTRLCEMNGNRFCHPVAAAQLAPTAHLLATRARTATATDGCALCADGHTLYTSARANMAAISLCHREMHTFCPALPPNLAASRKTASAGTPTERRQGPILQINDNENLRIDNKKCYFFMFFIEKSCIFASRMGRQTHARRECRAAFVPAPKQTTVDLL